MKSERAKQFIDGMSVTIEADGNRVISQSTVVGIWDVYIAINIAEQEAEERMREKAHKIIKEMMEGVFQGNMPQNIADEFSQKRKYPLIPTLWMIFEDSTFAFRSGDKHRSRRIYGK